MAVAAGHLTGRVWVVRGDIPDRIAHTAGSVGAGVGLVLAAALAALVVLTDTSLGNAVGWPIWLVLYPLSPLLGYDLAARSGAPADGPLLRLGGYSVALAAAHAAMATAIAVCVGLGVGGQSPLWAVMPALCVLVVAPARAVAVRAVRGLHGSGWALLGAAALILLMAWLFYAIAAGAYLSGIDS